MQNRTELNMNTSTSSNVSSFVQCVLELVGNSLSAHATAIAVRIHIKKREIYVIDNGIGIPKDKLEHITETISGQRQLRESSKLNSTLRNIRQSSDILTIASRYRDSTETFMKVFKMGHSSNLADIEQRPSRGTTVSVYGFRETSPYKNWDISTISFLIATVAVAKLQVSFSIRDEERKKVVSRIARPHSPIDVLRALFGRDLPLNHMWLIQCERNAKYDMNYHGYVGLSDENTIQSIFLNNRLICCPLILKLIEASFKEKLRLSVNQNSNWQDLHNKNILILIFLTFSRKTFTFVTKNGKRYVVFYNMRKVLSNIKNSIFKRLIEQIGDRDIAVSHSRETRLVKQIYLKPERSIIHSNVNTHDKNLTSLMKQKNIMIGSKRKKVTSASTVTNYSDQQYNKTNNIKAVSCYTKKGKNMLNNTQCQDVSTEHTELYEKEVADKVCNNVNKTPKSFTNSVTNDPTGFDNNCDHYDDNSNNFVKDSPLSVWSNWSYHTNEKQRSPRRNVNNVFSTNNAHSQELLKCARRFDFLPRKLCNLVRHRVKLINIQCLNSPNDAILFKENLQHKQIPVHPCSLKQKLCEFRLSRMSLKNIKIINQVNNKFIAACITYNKMQILLMMDQHAVHERIRYENLLFKYKAQNEDELLSTNLREPLAVKLSTETCNLLIRNKTLLKKYGVNLGSLKENTILIRTIPQCFVSNNDHCNNEKILLKIYGLFNDILKKRNTTNHANVLPLIIHNAIASEACHGAIKFGDELTVKQCLYLVKLLKNTKFPNRCAHGRPTVVPVIELSALEKRNIRKCEKKLNFAFLKNRHWNKI